MRINLKFDRRVNIRTRATDLRIFWYAIGAAVLAHVLFFSIFDHHRPARRSGEQRAGVTMLSAADFPAAGREGFRSWMKYHDPRSFDDCGFGEDVTEGVLRDARAVRPVKRRETVIPVRAAAVGAFREVPGRALPVRTLPPPPPREAAAPVASAAGKVTDGGGRELPLDGLKLLPRTPRTVGRTVLRVFDGGNAPVLLLDGSCGDGRLDGFAIRNLAFLARRQPTPEYIIVEWPEAQK